MNFKFWYDKVSEVWKQKSQKKENQKLKHKLKELLKKIA